MPLAQIRFPFFAVHEVEAFGANIFDNSYAYSAQKYDARGQK
jgi:hypothetical protein